MIGNQIKELRLKKKLTQDVFAKTFGITQKHLSQIETGKVGISNLLKSSICNQFNVNRQWLETGQGEMYTYNPEPGHSQLTDKGNGGYTPHPQDPPDMAELIEKFVYVMRSEDTVIKEALKQNVIAFDVAVHRAGGHPTQPEANDFKRKKKRAV